MTADIPSVKCPRTMCKYTPICRESCFCAGLCAVHWVHRPTDSCHSCSQLTSRCVTWYQEATTSTTLSSHKQQ